MFGEVERVETGVDRGAAVIGVLVEESIPEHKVAARGAMRSDDFKTEVLEMDGLVDQDGGELYRLQAQADEKAGEAAIEAAGLRAARKPQKGRASRWNLNAIADAMRVHSRRTGQPPRRTDWEHAGEDHPAASTVYRVAGSWRRALEAAGL